ncbi:hypothetical protein B0J14DRAFT_662248 [Halenospora varia]|nr:hypothetical protein B0J14DRAFT_662248 [Halenospora varia]
MGYTQRAIALITVSVVFPVLAMGFVALRIQTRKMRKMKLGADDYWILVALIIAVGGAVPYLVGAFKGGLGQTIHDVDLETLTTGGKMLFAYQFFYLFAVAAVKVSILYFYKRVFGNSSDGFIKVINIVLIFLLLWTIAFFFATLFQAWPISWNWDGVGKPTQYNIIYFVQTGTEILTDLVTLCLPIPMIKGLHVEKHKKTRIIGIFWLGGFCVVAAIVRLYYLTKLTNPDEVQDPLSQTVDILIWSSIMPCSSIICACLPILGPLRMANTVKGSDRVVRSVRSLFSLRSSKVTPPASEEKTGDTSQSSGQAYDDIVLPPMPVETVQMPNRWAKV